MPRFFSHFMTYSLLTFVLVLTSCSSARQISQDFKAGTDFKQYKTFSLRNNTSEIAGTKDQAIAQTIVQQLETQGFHQVAKQADLLLDINILKQQSTSAVTTGIGFGIGMPLGNHGGMSIGSSSLLGGSQKTNGVIIIDITDQVANRIIWRGNADAVPFSYFFPRNQAQLDSVLRALMAQFPPK
jgi:hypothetical protein